MITSGCTGPEEKIKTALITNLRGTNTGKIQVGVHEGRLKSDHCLMINAELNFKGHLDYARKNGSLFLARIVHLIRGPIYSRRLFIDGVISKKGFCIHILIPYIER